MPRIKHDSHDAALADMPVFCPFCLERPIPWDLERIAKQRERCPGSFGYRIVLQGPSGNAYCRDRLCVPSRYEKNGDWWAKDFEDDAERNHERGHARERAHEPPPQRRSFPGGNVDERSHGAHSCSRPAAPQWNSCTALFRSIAERKGRCTDQLDGMVY